MQAALTDLGSELSPVGWRWTNLISDESLAAALLFSQMEKIKINTEASPADCIALIPVVVVVVGGGVVLICK